MRLLSDLHKDYLNDKTVILRAGLNVPLDNNGNVVDTFRINAILPTLKHLIENSQKVIILSHIGRSRTNSLKPVFKQLQSHINDLYFSQWRDLQEDIKKHRIILVENLRQDPRETDKDSHTREEYAKDIIKVIGEDSVFVQDAFSVCHRAHSSIVELPVLLESYAGFLIEKEVQYLTKALNPPHEALFILGGAKFRTKEPLLRKFLNIYDKIFIGGAIANEFFKERGYNIGRSLIYDSKIPHDILYNNQIILPKIVQVADSSGHTVYINPKELVSDMRIVDAIPPTDLLSNPNFNYVLWNGPLGYYEGGYTSGTNKLLDMLKGSNAEIITGGGDTLATIGVDNRNIFNYISVGGGAMLRFLQGETLPGIKVLE